MSRIIYSEFSAAATGTTSPILSESEIDDINQAITDITDDGVITSHEKTTYFVPKMNELDQLATNLSATATERGISSSALDSALSTHQS